VNVTIGRHLLFVLFQLSQLRLLSNAANAAEMSMGTFSVTRSANHSKILTRPDQLMMMLKVRFSEYNIIILHVVEFIFRNLSRVNRTCARCMHSKQRK